MIKKQHKIGVFTLIMITSALIMTMRNMPMMAATGMQMIFFNFIAAFAFLIPVALVSAELATGWAECGIYVWVKEAFSPRLGFLAVWLQWSQSIFGMTSILSYVAASLAYVINPALASNKYFIFTIILVVYWGATFANLHGTKISGLISTVCVSFGVLLPTLMLIILGAFFIIEGNPVQLNTSITFSNIIPSIHDSRNLIMLVGFIFGCVGIEVSAAHARDVRDTHKNYPIAIFLTAILVFILTLLGGMTIAVVVPEKDISLLSGVMKTFELLFKHYNMHQFLPVFALLVGLGAAGQVSTWLVGPVKGLLATAQKGDLPPIFQKENKKGIPKNLLFFQATMISLAGIVILIVPDVNTAFLLLTSLAVMLYAIMYIIMFIAAIRLRHTQPNVSRPYKVPGGKPGMWIVSCVGILTVLACFIIGFIPPGDSHSKAMVLFYELFLIIGIFVMIAIPIFIYRFRRPDWKKSTKNIGTK